MKKTLLSLSIICGAILAQVGFSADNLKSENEFSSDTIFARMKKSANWHAQNPYPNLPVQEWEMSAFLDGLIALSKISDDSVYWAEVIRLGNMAGWSPSSNKYHADDHAVGHAFLETYRADKSKPYRLDVFKNHFDSIIADAKNWKDTKSQGFHSPVRSWNWCDALFMAPPTLARLYAITGDKKYLDYMNSEYKWCYDTLWSKDDDLFYRDASFIGKKSPNGKKIFWGRGNGWVFGGLTQIIDNLPKDCADRKFYEDLFKTMAARLVKSQGDDGLWSVNLADADHIKGGETSASGFFTYGLAWGVNNGLLDAATYKPLADKAWLGLLTRVQPSGMVGYVQPVGAAPDSFKPESTHAYGIGVFLLAGSEVAKMHGAKQIRTDAQILAEAQKLYDMKSVRAYVHREPRRKDDLAFENSKMAFRIYGPALKNSIENSGIDVWAKSVPYSIIDKWYDDDLAGIRSYHKDNGEGIDAFKVADTVGLGGTGIYKNGKIHRSNVYQVADIYWTTPSLARFNVYYFYDVDGEKYTERKEFSLQKDAEFCEVKSQFAKGHKKNPWWEWSKYAKKNPAGDIQVATGILPQSKDAKVDFDNDKKSISVIGTLEKKPFDMELILDSKTDVVEFKKLESGEVVAIIKPNKEGRISSKFGYKWGKQD